MYLDVVTGRSRIFTGRMSEKYSYKYEEVIESMF
jgi:hypothetical protein